jgi:hypothetical protein
LENEILLIDEKTAQESLFAVLTKWRRKNAAEHPYTWHTIIEALNQPSLQEDSLARDIDIAEGK